MNEACSVLLTEWKKGHKIKAYLVMRKILLNSVRVTATLIYDCNEIRNDNEFYGEE